MIIYTLEIEFYQLDFTFSNKPVKCTSLVLVGVPPAVMLVLLLSCPATRCCVCCRLVATKAIRIPRRDFLKVDVKNTW